MSYRPQGAAVDAAWVAGPGLRRVLAMGWGLFAVVDVLTRLRVYGNLEVALGVSLVLDPVIILLAAALHAAFDRLRLDGRISAAALPWIIGLSLASSAVVVAVGTLIRTWFGLGMSSWAREDAAVIVLVHYFMVFIIWSLVCFWMKAEGARQGERHRAAQAEAQALRTEVQRLRLQLDPHFLFNALNGIAEEIPDHPDAALAMVQDLAVFLRQSLSGIDTPIATIGEEAQALASYLRVQEARFGARLAARVDIEAAATARRIPSFLLQPLVENAIRHGSRDPRLDIGIRTAGDRLHVTITNSGELADGRTTGIGVANVRQRLALHYPDRHQFSLTQRGETVVARLTLEGEPCFAS